MNIQMCLASPADAPAMAEILMRSWEAAYKDIIPAEAIREKNAARPAMFAKLITDENTTHYVIRKDGEIVGILCIAPPNDDDLDAYYYELHAIYLHPDYYRQGIGGQAMAFALDIARELGKKAVSLWVLAQNLNSIRFYEKYGFKADGKTKTLHYGKELTCVRMRRVL